MVTKIDFAFSEEGDLILGGVKTDDEGNPLYIHQDGTISNEPIKDGIEGKFIRDLAYTTDRTTYKQIIMNRLKTDAPDWFHYPRMGGNLSDLIGEPNTRETGEKGVELIIDALTYAGFLHPREVDVRAVPISTEEIMFVITVLIRGEDPLRLPLVLDLNHGIKEV